MTIPTLVPNNNPVGKEQESTPGPENITVADLPAMARHVIICGLGNLGFRIAEQLQIAGVPLIVVDDVPDPRLVRRLNRSGIKLIEDDSRVAETLIEAGIHQATAIVACADNDLHNLETILLANDLVNGICSVASFFNQNVGNQLTKALPNATALSVSEKAGFSFMEASVSNSVLHLLTILDQKVAVVEAHVTQAGPLHQNFGNLTVLAVKDAEPSIKPIYSRDSQYSAARNPALGSPRWEICPPPQFVARPSQTVMLAGRVDDLRKLKGVHLIQADLQGTVESLAVLQSNQSENKPPDARHKAKPHNRNWIAELKYTLTGLVNRLDKSFLIALSVLLSFIVISTLTLVLFYHNSLLTPDGQPQKFGPLDALYFTVTILATVGFGDYSFAFQEWPLKVFGIILTLLGTASVSVIYAFITNFIVSRRIEKALGSQRTNEMEDHVVICGLGAVGYQVMRGLVEQGTPVCVIEKSEQGRFNAAAKSLGVPLILGDSRLSQVLQTANIGRAKAVTILSSDDLANLETALTAHAEYYSNPDNSYKRLQFVLRVFDNGLAERIAKNFEFRQIYSASTLTAPYFVAASLGYEVISTFYLDRYPFIIVKIPVKAGFSLDGLSLLELYNQTGTWVMAHISSGQRSNKVPSQFLSDQYEIGSYVAEFQPDLELRLQGGDTVYIAGPNDQIIKTYQLNLKFKEP